ncbi:LysR family transcriptional regulator [Microbaculum marinum]|uniref:LysR family transcriptional regulator n=1 Tax=Microbaculum marinum TaxID=1764581 RepID=A0AAW9RT82_9HYPH
MISFRQFEVIRAVMRSGTVTEAARMLGITQPAVSRLLRHTEDKLGLALFIRGRGRLRPSDVAWSLFPYIEKLFESLEAAQRATAELQTAELQRLRIVSTPAISTCVLPNVIHRIEERYGRAAISLETMANFEAASAVANGRADIGFVFVPPDYPDLDSIELGPIPIMAAMRADNPQAEHEMFGIDAMQLSRLISLPANLPIGAAIVESAQRHSVDLRLSIEVTDSFTACSLADVGIGIALVDALTIELLPNLVARPLQIAPFVRAKALLAAGRRRLSLVKHLLEEVRLVCPIKDGPEYGSLLDTRNDCRTEPASEGRN